MPVKFRADQLMITQGLVQSRTRAQALIMAGKVFQGEIRVDKPGQQFPRDTPLWVKEPDHPWVSRGGLKLAHALEAFEISAEDSIVLDLGASTGGFTDVTLAGGAARVYAVDVGHGQLDWKLRKNPRVTVLENTNARYLTEAQVGEAPDLIVCDASFIGLATVLPAALALARPGARLVALIKPQFEVGKDEVGKGGVVRDPALHEAVCQRVSDWLNSLPDWRVTGIVESPVKGPQGNIEFLITAVHDADAPEA